MRVIEGVLPHEHPLSPKSAFRALPRGVRRLVDLSPDTIWEQDTARLPRSLRKYRRRARAFADRVLRPLALEADLDPHGPKVTAMLTQAARAGYLSDFLPRPFGSSPWTMVFQPLLLAQSLKTEELCAACAGLGLILSANGLGAAPIFFSTDLGAIRRFLVPGSRESLRGNPHVFAFAITEPAGGSDVEDSTGGATYKPGTVARKAPGGWLLNGRKVFISGGDIAKTITVFAALEGEGLESWTCFLVKNDMPGFSVARTENKMGQRASGAAELVFEDVFVPERHVIGGLRGGWALNRVVLDASRIPVGAIALGVARGAAESAIAFARTETVGGKRLVDYQDVQLALAQMLIDLEAIRSTVWRAASTWRLRQSKSSIVKVFASDLAVRVCEDAMDLMGNHGTLHGRGAEKSFRDARVTQIFEGTNQVNRLAIIEDQMEELLGAAPAAGR